VSRHKTLVSIALPAGLHPDTQDLVRRFAEAMATKLRAAERKHGYTNNWKEPGWDQECGTDLLAHLAKGDPTDVANYCAFMWHHGWRTSLHVVAYAEHRS